MISSFYSNGGPSATKTAEMPASSASVPSSDETTPTTDDAPADDATADAAPSPPPDARPDDGPAAVVGVSKNRTRRLGDAVAKRFFHFGEVGFYEGDLDGEGRRRGAGKMTYENGNSYEGEFVDDKFHGRGVYRWFDGDEHEGSWREGGRHGDGIFRAADGVVEYSTYEGGRAKGEGVTWSADRKRAHGTTDGRRTRELKREEAERLAREAFGLPVPEPSEAKVLTTTTTTVADPAVTASASARSLGFLERMFSSRKVGPDGSLLFKDHGEWGTYDGDVDAAGNRQGRGTMTYEGGGSYDGGFLDDKFHGEGGTYRWADGDEHSGGWAEGERHGVGSCKNADGSVEISGYRNGSAAGEGVTWSADRKTAYRTSGGIRKDEISTAMAEKLARDKFDLPVPEPSTGTAAARAAPGESVGFLGRLFANRKAGPDGKMLFYDHGEWGSYEGDVDEAGNRQGRGKMAYDGGNLYEGGFVDDKFHGDDGTYRWSDGDRYFGQWAEGERHGIGSFTNADGSVQISRYEKGSSTGEGVTWSADRKTAHKTSDGSEKEEISLGMAEKMAKDKFDLPVPGISTISESSAAATKPVLNKNLGFIGRLFADRKMGPDGKMLFHDYGEWGSYEGDDDDAGNRQGRGKMTYDSGNSYEGWFLDDKFDGPEGTYRWSDGEEYAGSWKDGERHGVGIFRRADGAVDYSIYEKGAKVGEGLSWSAGRESAHKLEDGIKKMQITPVEAEKLAKDHFDLPVPEPTEVKGTPTAAVPIKSTGFLGSLFSTRKVGPDGKTLFKDNGEWGTYEGELDVAGNRHGHGKMTYDSNNCYEGGFVDDKYGDKGIYHWSNGDEYEGWWKDGERGGIGIFRSADGGVNYSLYESGSSIKDGVGWSADRKTAHKTVRGTKFEISLAIAEKVAKDKFDLPVPEPAKVLSPSTAPAAPSSSSIKKVGFLGRLFSNRRVGANGKMEFKDHGDWGIYEGDVDADGNRQGRGKMTYDGGNSYEGGFMDDKFDGPKGTYRWQDGEEYEGSWKDGERHGAGIFRSVDGTVDYSIYEKGTKVGGVIWWSADRKTAHATLDGKKRMEMLIEEAEAMAKREFDLPIPEVGEVVPPPAAAATPAPTGLLRRLFYHGEDGVVGPDGKVQYKDHGDWGTYEGEFDDDSAGRRRHGGGKMTYASGNSYEGPFANNKYHGPDGTYRWADGDEYVGSWAEGERNGVGVFRMADGTVEYATYAKGRQVGEGLAWSPDRRTIIKMVDGVKKEEISPGVAEKRAKEAFGLPVPEPGEVPSTTSASKPSLLGRMFRSKENGVGPSTKDGPWFEDFGDMGTYYEGELVDGLRQGKGKMRYDSGNSYEGDFSNGKFDGDRGLYRWSDGTEYEGSWKEGAFHGNGVFRSADGGVDYSAYEAGYAAGVGVGWSADRKTAYHTLDGVEMDATSLSSAAKLAKDKFGLPAPSFRPRPGIVRRLFGRSGVVPDGRPVFKDHGAWGSWDGDVDAEGKRCGRGRMAYECGHSYEGGFVEDRYHGDDGTYRWSDGDEYSGQWKEGERHGKGRFKHADGSVEFSMYDRGSKVGDGIVWSADRRTSHRLVDGKKKDEISLAMAEKLARDEFDLPVPEPSTVLAASSKSLGFLERFFSKRRVGPDGKMQFKDYGDWGSYEGDVDEAGNRQGRGKMMYDSGNYYEGGFVDDKFHCDEGTYCWSDGGKYFGQWKDGERHGRGSFKNADGSVEYSAYEMGQEKGDGVMLSADGKTAHALLDGKKKLEILVEEAESLVKEKFDFMNWNIEVPEPSTVPSQSMTPLLAASSKIIGFLERFVSKRRVGPDGKLQFKDHNDWGSYEGDVDEAGNRQGRGKMMYDSGNYYEGGFVDDKFHCDEGTYCWSDGDKYFGQWKDGERHGMGSFKNADGSVEYSAYEMGQAKGDGVMLSADGKTAHALLDGEKKLEMLVEEAESLVKEKFDFMYWNIEMKMRKK